MRFLLAVLSVLALLTIMLVGSAGADATIGIYNDEVGSSCSLTGNDVGLMSAYVVIRPGPAGVRGVRFSAPIPSCFDATFLSESTPEYLVSAGTSLTGISISSGGCETLPFYALRLLYFNNGNTDACCPFPVREDQATGLIEAVDCQFNSTPVTGVTSYVNANASCACTDVPAPFPPSNPSPPNGSVAWPVSVLLNWSAQDPSGLPMTADLYLGTDANPPLVATDVPVQAPYTSYYHGVVEYGTKYYWRVVLRNSAQAEVSGPVWNFTTRTNFAPVVTQISPANGALAQPLNVKVLWDAVDAENDDIVFDIYFGTTPNPPRIGDTLAYAYDPDNVTYLTTYWWKIVARDSNGQETATPIWSFTTKDPNEPPSTPQSPSPPNNSVNRPIVQNLVWNAADPEGQPLTFDVYFGTAASPPLVASNHGSKTYPLATLQLSTTYRWRIVARDAGGLVTSGPLWTFTTRSNAPPNVASSPSPANGSTGRSIATTLAWEGTDPDGDVLTFDVYHGTTPTPPLVFIDGGKSYTPPSHAYLTTYYWRVVARDPFGLTTSGPTWSYTTHDVNDAPLLPSNPFPVVGSTGVIRNPKLTWEASDPQGQALTYDVYFGTAASPPLKSSSVSVASYLPGVLAAQTTYRWRIVARDTQGLTTSGPIWEFATGTQLNLAPTVPASPIPPDQAFTGINPQLAWYTSDPEQDPLTYLVFFGVSSNPALYDVTFVPQFSPGPLQPGQQYYWRVVVMDDHGSSIEGPTWSFTVNGGGIPVAFSSFVARPSDAGVELRWELVSDEDMERFTVYRRSNQEAAPRVIASGDVSSLRGSYVDASVEAGKTYHYELMIKTKDGDEFRSQVAMATMPALELALHQNVPNPFNPQTTIRYDLPPGGGTQRVRLFIVDLSGRRVRTLVDQVRSGGAQSVVWNGRDDNGNAVSSGVYFYVLEAGKERLTRKLVLLK